MSALPEQVRALVVSGVYAMYAVQGEPYYALVTTAGEFYLLSRDGDIVHDPRYRTLESTPLEEAVTFAESPGSRLNSI